MFTLGCRFRSLSGLYSAHHPVLYSSVACGCMCRCISSQGRKRNTTSFRHFRHHPHSRSAASYTTTGSRIHPCAPAPSATAPAGNLLPGVVSLLSHAATPESHSRRSLSSQHLRSAPASLGTRSSAQRLFSRHRCRRSCRRSGSRVGVQRLIRHASSDEVQQLRGGVHGRTHSHRGAGGVEERAVKLLELLGQPCQAQVRVA
mgnify:CR=1 FL=1